MNVRTTRRRLSVSLALAMAVAGLGGAASARAQSPTESELTPYGLAVDAAGNVFIADAANAVVKKVDPSGSSVSVVAGIPGSPGLPTPGPATSSKLSVPSALAIDGAGNLFIADSGETQAVVEVTPEGTLSVVAGVPGQSRRAVDPGPATSSELSGPSGLAVDGAGNLFISDVFHAVVSKVDVAGDLSIAAGISGAYGQPTPFGPAVDSHLYLATGLVTDVTGNLYIADSGNHVVSKVNASGDLSVVAGIVGEIGTPTAGYVGDSRLRGPTGLALDEAGNLYVADPLSHMVIRVELASGDLSIVAGTGEQGRPSPGPATSSRLDGPTDLAVDQAGNLFIADGASSLVLKVDPSGDLSIFAGTGGGLDFSPPPVRDDGCASGRLRGSYRDVTVPAGRSCTLDGARLTGNLVADGAASVVVTGAKIEGDLLIRGTQGLSVTESDIGGDATIEDNSGGLTFQNNTVRGRLRFLDNTGFPDSLMVIGNTIEEGLTCSGNDGLATECNAAGTAPAQNSAPSVNDDAPDALDEDTVLTVGAPGVLGNDTDPDQDALQAVQVTGPSYGTLALAADGSFTYTPNENFAGEDSFTYRATDGQDTSGVATVRLRVTPVNDPPSVTAIGTSCSGNGTGGTFALAVADVETAADRLIVTATSSASAVLPAHGVKLSGSGAGRALALIGAWPGRATLTVIVSDGLEPTTLPIALTGAGKGADTVIGTGGPDLLLGRNGKDALSGLGADDLLCGGGGDDLLLGGDGDDRLDGAAGHDLLYGGNGDDRLTGGTGADLFSGGAGTDVATDLKVAQRDTQDGTVP